MLTIFLLWLFFSFVIGAIGSERKIGFLGAFFIALIFSPLIGLIVALISTSKAVISYRSKMLEFQKLQNEMLEKLAEQQK